MLSFKVISLLVLEKKIFKDFTIYGHSGHVGHVTQLICINFHSYSPSSFHMNFGSNSLICFLEKQVLTLKSESPLTKPGRLAQLVGHLTRKSGVLGSIPGLATCFRLSFRFFKKGSCQLLVKVCAQSTG